jgi:hypothetical protein
MNARCSALALVLAGFAGTAHAAPEIDVLASAALGDELGGRPASLGLFDDGSVVLVGADEGGGTLVRLDAVGVAKDGVERLAGSVHDVAVDRSTGHIALVGEAEIVVLDDRLDVVWRVALPTAHDGEHAPRIAAGELGTIAVVAAGELRTFSADGSALASVVLAEDATSGVAVLDGEDLVVTTGWSERHACGRALDVAALSGFTRDGVARWRAWGDVDETALCDRPASTRGIDVAHGEDGLVYLLAEVEGPANVFADENNVGFDAITTTDGVASSRFAYYARVSSVGEHVVGQFFAFPDEDAVVAPSAIAADAIGNVLVTGTTSHRLEADDDVIHSEALYAPAGFYQVVRSDFRARELWQSLEIDDTSTTSTAIALAGARVVTLLHTTRLPNAPSAPAGPMVLVWPTDPKAEPPGIPKRPDRDDVGTFGYESGVAGSDPTCYACGPTRAPTPIGVLALAAAVIIGRPRRR